MVTKIIIQLNDSLQYIATIQKRHCCHRNSNYNIFLNFSTTWEATLNDEISLWTTCTDVIMPPVASMQRH